MIWGMLGDRYGYKIVLALLAIVEVRHPWSRCSFRSAPVGPLCSSSC